MRDKTVEMIIILLATQLASLVLMVALEGYNKPNAGLVYIVFPPWATTADDERRIVEAGGRLTANPVWGFVFRAAVKDGMVARIAMDGAILAFVADRRTICSSPVVHV